MSDKGLPREEFNDVRSILCRGCDRKASECSYAHSITWLMPPTGARTRCTSPLSVSVQLPGFKQHQPVVIPLSECYRSMVTRKIDRDPSVLEDENVVFSICVHWVRNGGKCTHWQNCKYLHPTLTALNAAFKHRFCHVDRCYGRDCPLAHSADELVAPDTYEPLDLSAHRSDQTTVLDPWLEESRSINTFLIMKTRARKSELCPRDAECDYWSQCNYVHTWESVREACQRNPRLQWVSAMVKRTKGF